MVLWQMTPSCRPGYPELLLEFKEHIRTAQGQARDPRLEDRSGDRRRTAANDNSGGSSRKANLRTLRIWFEGAVPYLAQAVEEDGAGE